MSKKTYAQCAKCTLPRSKKSCFTPNGKGVAFCPTLKNKDMAQEVFDSTDAGDRHLLRTSFQQEAASYTHAEPNSNQPPPYKPRIEEIVGFCQRMGYKRLGLIFCAGSNAEAQIVQEILTVNGFEVMSIACKVGQIPKTRYGISPEHLLDCKNTLESSCNPKLQAMLANEAQIDFAILLNLCVGHDSVVIKHLEAPVTFFSVKDRLLGHYPLLAIYQYEGSYRYLKKPLPVCEPVATLSTASGTVTGTTNGTRACEPPSKGNANGDSA